MPEGKYSKGGPAITDRTYAEIIDKISRRVTGAMVREQFTYGSAAFVMDLKNEKLNIKAIPLKDIIGVG
jgi:hypothetical protein